MRPECRAADGIWLAFLSRSFGIVAQTPKSECSCFGLPTPPLCREVRRERPLPDSIFPARCPSVSVGGAWGMGWFQRLRTLGKRLLEGYEHARSILELLGLNWRDIRDAATLTAALAPVIRLQDLPIQWLGLSILAAFTMFLAAIAIAVWLWKNFRDGGETSPRLALWRAFRRFVSVVITVGLAVSWYNAGRQNQPEAPSPRAPIATAPYQTPPRQPSSYTSNEKDDLRNALRELSKILNTDGVYLGNKTDAAMAAWTAIIDYAKPSSVQDLQNNLAETTNAAVKLRSDLEDMNGPLKEYWSYHGEILAVINFSDKPNSPPEVSAQPAWSTEPPRRIARMA
jgi:hypothetical protein